MLKCWFWTILQVLDWNGTYYRATILIDSAKPNPNMVVRNLRTVRQIYHSPNAATIQKYELSDFEAHCPCRIPDVSIITKQNRATTAKIVVANGIVDTAYALFRADRVDTRNTHRLFDNITQPGRNMMPRTEIKIRIE